MCFRIIRTFKAVVMLAASVLIGTTAFAQSLPVSGGAATASTQLTASRAAAFAIDGNSATRWEASNSSSGSWLRVSFAEAKTIQALILHEYGNRIAEHRVEYLNGTVWSVLGVGAGIGASLTYTFPSVTTTAVRVFIVRASAQPSITEFGVFGTEEPDYYPGCKMPVATQTFTVTSPIVVGPGQDFDGGNARYNQLGGGEAVMPVFNVAEGGTVHNVIIGPQAGGGIHCLGNCTLRNVWWEGVGEGAATALGGGGTVMTVECGAAYKSTDRIFQHNGLGAVKISHFYGSGAGKFYRSCGECTANGGPRRVTIDGVITRNLPITAGINENFGDVATIRNLLLDNTNSTPTNICRVYVGVQRGLTSMILGREFSTPNCNVAPADVSRRGPSQFAPASCTGSCMVR